MRIAVPMRRRVLALTLFALALLALLPLRLAVGLLPFEQAGIGARTVTGSVWAGRIGGLAWRGVGVGDVSARVEILPLLLGRIRLAVRGDDLAGALIATPGGTGVEDLTGTLATPGGLDGLPIESLTADRLSIRFAAGRCVRAGGRIGATIALPGATGPQLLAGTPRCDGAFLLLPLAGATGLERIDLRIGADGRLRSGATPAR